MTPMGFSFKGKALRSKNLIAFVWMTKVLRKQMLWLITKSNDLKTFSKRRNFWQKRFPWVLFWNEGFRPKNLMVFFFFFFLKGTWCRKITFFVYQKKISIQNGCLKKYFLRSKNHFLKERIRKKEKSFGEKIEKCPFGRPFRVLKVKLLLNFFFLEIGWSLEPFLFL